MFFPSLLFILPSTSRNDAQIFIFSLSLSPKDIKIHRTAGSNNPKQSMIKLSRTDYNWQVFRGNKSLRAAGIPSWRQHLKWALTAFNLAEVKATIAKEPIYILANPPASCTSFKKPSITSQRNTHCLLCASNTITTSNTHSAHCHPIV